MQWWYRSRMTSWKKYNYYSFSSCSNCITYMFVIWNSCAYSCFVGLTFRVYGALVLHISKIRSIVRVTFSSMFQLCTIQFCHLSSPWKISGQGPLSKYWKKSLPWPNYCPIHIIYFDHVSWYFSALFVFTFLSPVKQGQTSSLYSGYSLNEVVLTVLLIIRPCLS